MTLLIPWKRLAGTGAWEGGENDAPKELLKLLPGAVLVPAEAPKASPKPLLADVEEGGEDAPNASLKPPLLVDFGLAPCGRPNAASTLALEIG